MSDHKDTKLEIIDLLPNEIRIDPRYDIRAFERHSTAQSQQQSMEELELLADNIEARGQLDAVCITPDRILVCGHRRCRAVAMINERRTTRSQPLLKLHCSITAGGDLVLQALSSNLQRRNISPVDLAYYLHNFRKERNLLGLKGIVMTARLLHLKRHVIENSEKLMNSSKAIQNQLHDGSISTDTALMLMQAGIPTEDLARVFDRGREIQQENATLKTMQAVEAKRKAPAAAAKELAGISSAKRIQRPAIVESLREYRSNKSSNGASKAIPLSYSDFLKGLTAADNSALCGPARRLIRFLVKDYAAGKSTQAELERQFSIAFADDSLASVVPVAACYLR